MQEYCAKYDIKQARVLVGWGYSSESQDVPKYSDATNAALPGCDFRTPCNSIETLTAVADKDAFDRTISELGLPGIPNYGVSFGKDFSDEPAEVFQFLDKLFADFPEKETITIYFKHPSTGGGRGIIPITFDKTYNETSEKDKYIDQINEAVSTCHREGASFLAEGETRPIVLQMGIENAWHIEGQCIGKSVIALRECSAQERGQKKAEGTVPSYLMTEDEKTRLMADMKKFALENNLSGANTVEVLIYDGTNKSTGKQEKKWVFLEVNTRLQVENWVTGAEKGCSVPGQILADSFDIDIAPIQQHFESRSIRHIRLTGIPDGSAKILTTQKEMQALMDEKFGTGVVRVFIKKNQEIDTTSDQQFGALVINSNDENPKLASDVLTFFEDNFHSQALTVPYRTIRAVLDKYEENEPFQVGQYIPPAPPSDTERLKAQLTIIGDRILNTRRKKGESVGIESAKFKSLEAEVQTLLGQFQTKHPKSEQTSTLSSDGWQAYHEGQEKVTFSIENRDYLQSLLAHVTQPEITKYMQNIVNHLPRSVAMSEAPGISGAGPQMSANVHGKDPESNRLFSAIPNCGLERGLYMNALAEASDEDRAAMKKLSHLIESETYGTFDIEGETFSNYIVTDFDAQNNATLNATMVFENMVFRRPAYMTLSWNPTMKKEDIRKYIQKEFSEYKRLQSENPDAKVPDPLGYYIKCPSTTDAISGTKVNEMISIIQEEYTKIYKHDIPNIKLHMHNLIAGERKDHQTKVAQDVKTIFESDKSKTRLTIASTFSVGDVGASHPDISQLSPERDQEVIADATEIMEKLHLMMQAYDVSHTVSPENPSFEGPGGMAATAHNDLEEVKRNNPDNEALQQLDYETAIEIGVNIFGMRTLVTPMSQFMFLAGIEIVKEYGVVENSKLNIAKTKEALIKAINDGNLKCKFPDNVIKAMQIYNSDFPNPCEENILKVLAILGKPKIEKLPTLQRSYSSSDLEIKKLNVEKALGFPPTNEDLLTALRFGINCDYLQNKSKMGAGSEIVSAENFFTLRQGLKVGDTIETFTLTDVRESNLNYVLEFQNSAGKVVTVSPPNEVAIEAWVNEELKGTNQHISGDPGSIDFSPYIGSKITGVIPQGTTVIVSKNGDISLEDSSGTTLPALDPMSPKTFLQLERMKMGVSLSYPDLSPGHYQFTLPPYTRNLLQGGTVHAAAKGFAACNFKPIKRGLHTMPTTRVDGLPRTAPSNIMVQNVARFAQTISKFLKYVPK